MGLEYVRITTGFEDYMPKDYVDLVKYGQFGKEYDIQELGTFKELLEEHPMCAGCFMAYFVRVFYASLPNPEDTIVIGTAGCARLALSQAAVPFIYGNYGDTNAVASGLKRALKIRFPDKEKDVVVVAGDGGLMDIGFGMTMHSWFRRENFTTIMVDNEVYGNTGGQESGMTRKGIQLKMAPKGKKFDKINVVELAKAAGCVYVARISPTNPKRIAKTIKRAILAARHFGPTFIHAYTSCNIEYSIPTEKVLEDARKREKEDFAFYEYMTDEVKEYFEQIENKGKQQPSEVKA
ncbi:subunit of 2-oxoglutarate:ferredoxin oxidoredutase [Sulfurihydrogenibium azorense Az-Fu1]|uniref:Subunit of 2-oxoglutarate:ferredoxin oxidoredutase n=1 Tax=Sulfurihydrogenibium azorense (strain DSM 15241 / OCM 825 / Az-Fu1) TaxID=204536 RepID=C1DU41_SULAA|nr:thiamine pyrophosphate-dependent enzyme [Sulfurihydrogenibium azorense]ACN99310.1 subunit of 2-oxoglutarate:ferredoxin oxidoredutase [Sulfurihydrogenibium azorense Az-Fu1]